MFTERKVYLKHPEAVEERYSCMFCTDVPQEPVMCEGPCKSICCRKCASNWFIHKETHNVSCPKKCSSPWRIRLIEHAPIEMCCPYSKECVVPSLEGFNQHIQSCPYQPPEKLEQYRRRSEFICDKGHKLDFFIGSYEQMTKSICGGCGEREVVKSHCIKCEIRYCIGCRPLACSQAGCPVGHPFRQNKIPNKSCICDVCGMAGAIVGLSMFEDYDCNFDVCRLCYNKLPKSLSENPILKHIQSAKKENKCYEGHILTKIAQPSPRRCWNCEKTRVCWKECQTCSVSFCVNCKSPALINDSVCAEGHVYEYKPLEGHCMKCDAEHTHFVVDTECHIQLCPNCARNLSSISNQKRRMKQAIACEKRHPVFFYNGRETNCQICHETKYCRLACTECIPYAQYCCKCRQLNLSETCYFGDPLKQLEQPLDCDVCGQEKQVAGCLLCSFVICKECQEKSKTV